MKKLFMQILITLTVAIIALPAWSQQQLQKHLGPLTGIVQLGQNGPWNAASDQNWFILSNTTKPGDIQYYWLDRRQNSANYQMSTKVAVRATGRDVSYGGLLFNFRDGPEYFGITVGSDRSATVFVRHQNGIETQSAEGILARGDGSDVLTVTVIKTTVRFDLNNEKLFEISSQNGFSSKMGIFAVGTGSFGFTGFNIIDGQMNSGGNAPAGGPPPLPQSSEGPPPLPNSSSSGPPPLPKQAQGNLVLDQLYLSSALGIFAHELGHAIIGETKLPSTGPEEDVADSFAAYILASAYAEAPPENKQFIKGVVDYSSLTWFHLATKAQNSNAGHDWQDEHSPDIKRFRNWFCIVYGSNPNVFNDVAAKVGFTDRSKARCRYDYDRKLKAWEELLATRGRNLGPDLPGKLPANAPGGKAVLTFHPPETKYGKYIEHLLKSNKTVSLTSDFVAAYFVLPRDLKIDFRDCREVNAWYNPEKGKVTVCYSAIEWFATITAQGEGLIQ